jgi:tight adherence protein B
VGTALIVIPAILGIALLGLPPGQWRWLAVRQWLDECGLSSVSTGVIGVGIAALMAVVVGVTSLLIPIPVVAPLAGVAAVAVPLAVLDSARSRRRRSAIAAWPNVIDAIRMALRAGLPVHDAVRAAHSHVPAEWRNAWAESTMNASVGTPLNHVLRDLRRELADPVGDRLCETIETSLDVGGTELPLVLDELARSVRAEQLIRRDAVARQSWVKHAARLGSAAPWIVVVMLATRADAREAFSSAAGASLLVACAGATVVAFAVMSALGRLPDPPRWSVDA